VENRIFANELVKKQQGSTQSVLACCSDGGSYVLKFFNNPLGPNALISEVVTARLGHLLGLPVADWAFVEVDEGLVNHKQAPLIEEGTVRRRYASGVHFGSRNPLDYRNPTQVMSYFPPSLVGKVEDLPAFAGALVLDAWTGSTGFRQVVYATTPNSSGYSPTFIGHAHSFTPFFEADSKNSRPASHYAEFYDFVRGWGSFEPWLTIAQTATRADLEALVGSFPPEWQVADLLKTNLLQYLLDRQSKIKTNLDALREGEDLRFKNWGKPPGFVSRWAVRMEAEWAARA
jgi:hypothetical protein